MRPLSLALVVLLAPFGASAQCRSSPAGAYSLDLRLSPRAGVRCLHITDVYAGASCASVPEWSIELHCSRTSRIAVTDTGRLISVLAPRASRRDWNILHVVGRDRRPVWVRLGDVPGIEMLTGTVTLEFDGGSVWMRTRRGEARASFASIEARAGPR